MTSDSSNSDFRRYLRRDAIVFFKTREAFGGLSNMAGGFPLHINGITVPSSEALYQACRFPHLPDVQEQIIKQSSPMTAKMKSKPYRKMSREDWEDVKVAIMKWCLKIKLIQHWAQFGGLLLSTAAKPIVEQSRNDSFWGAIPEQDGEILRGLNVLGRLLMDLRERLKKNPDEFASVPPLPIHDFCLLKKEIPSIARNQVHDLERNKQFHLGHF